MRAYAPCVCLLHVSVSFVERASGRPLRYGGINPDGEALHDSDGNPVYTLEGRAPEVRADFFGTGFIAGKDRILTNHHVAQPWWKNDELAAVSSQGLTPSIAEMTAYFPDAKAGVPVSVSEISEQADLAVLKGDLSGLKNPILKIDARKEAAVSGQPLLSLGYATGISAILARVYFQNGFFQTGQIAFRHREVGLFGNLGNADGNAGLRVWEISRHFGNGRSEPLAGNVGKFYIFPPRLR